VQRRVSLTMYDVVNQRHGPSHEDIGEKKTEATHSPGSRVEGNIVVSMEQKVQNAGEDSSSLEDLTS
jgi:hypothetical protein